jgi:hypothetical protein
MFFQARACEARPGSYPAGPPGGIRGLLRHPLAHGRAQHRQDICEYLVLNEIQNSRVNNVQTCTVHSVYSLHVQPEAEFLDEIQTKLFTVFLPAIQSQLYSFPLRFLFLQTHATV